MASRWTGTALCTSPSCSSDNLCPNDPYSRRPRGTPGFFARVWDRPGTGGRSAGASRTAQGSAVLSYRQRTWRRAARFCRALSGRGVGAGWSAGSAGIADGAACRVSLTRSRVIETLESYTASTSKAKHLDVEPGFPLILLQDQIYSKDNTLFEYTRVYFRGDRVKIRIQYDS